MSYKALSYTWGGLENAGFMRLYVDGFDIEVKDSLLTALRYIRHESEDLFLWVDALCINQNDDYEKGYQVNQMGLVYETAEEVIVWLGPSAEGTKPLFGLINELDEQMTVYNRESDHDSWEDLCRKHMSPLWTFPDVRNALLDLVHRPWFERVWIIQEIAKARRATIRCGELTCKARTFCLAPALMDIEVPRSTQAVLDVMPRLRTDSWWTSDRSLHSLIRRFRDHKATEDRDKIYALLGVSDDANDPMLFTPSYKQSEQQAINQTALFLACSRTPEAAVSLPDFSLSELYNPISEIAQKIFESTLTPGALMESRRAMAMALIDSFNQGKTQVFTQDYLVSLAAQTRGREAEMRILLGQRGAQLGLLFSTNNLGITLTISSPEVRRSMVYFEFVSERHRFPLIERMYKDRPDPPTGRRRLRSYPPFRCGSNRRKRKRDTSPDDPEALLRFHAWKGNDESMKELLADGVDAGEADESGWTALHAAASGGHVEIVKLLAETCYEDFDKWLDVRGPHNMTPVECYNKYVLDRH